MLRMTVFAVLGLAGIIMADAASAKDYNLGSLKIEQPWARATVTQTGGAYLTIDNGGPPDKLVGVQTEVAQKAELHRHIMEGNVMKMVPVPGGIALPAGKTTLQPGGYHIMLLGMKGPLKPGTTFPLKLTFEKAGTIEVTVTVAKAGAMGPPGQTGGDQTGGMGTMGGMDHGNMDHGTMGGMPKH
jgi:copper(I)-binding protein